MTGFVILGVLVLIAAAAPRYGVDSRPGAAGRRHTVTGDVRSAFAWFERVLARVTQPVSTRH
jgi:hypothetical protein